VLVDGQIVRSGGKELAFTLEERGYDWVSQETAAPAGATT
jgi:Fe-S cluster assembly ATP-binding protein